MLLDRRALNLGYAVLPIVAVSAGCQSDPNVDGKTSAADTSGLASIAQGQLGCGACGGGSSQSGQTCSSYENSCNEAWCADFVRWVWTQGGYDTTNLTAAAGSFYTYGQANGTLHMSNPQVGDAVVWEYAGNGYADHVEIVVDVSNAANGTITGISGNGCNSDVCEDHPCATAGECDSYTSGWTLSGFVSPAGTGNGSTGTTSSSGGGTGGSDPCGSLDDGGYCGNDPSYGGGSGDGNTLYTCSGGVTSNTEACSGGCTIAPGTENDYCNAGSAGTGSTGTGSTGTGSTGTGSTGTGSTGSGSTGTGSTGSGSTGSGSTGSGSTGNGSSAPSDPCTYLDNGAYCGDDSDYNGGSSNASTLYKCTNGVTIGSQYCSNGCAVASGSQDDYCKQLGGGGAKDPCSTLNDGDYCGNDQSYGGGKSSSSTLYVCSGGATVGSETCTSGCTIASGANDDYCN